MSYSENRLVALDFHSDWFTKFLSVSQYCCNFPGTGSTSSRSFHRYLAATHKVPLTAVHWFQWLQVLRVPRLPFLRLWLVSLFFAICWFFLTRFFFALSSFQFLLYYSVLVVVFDVGPLHSLTVFTSCPCLYTLLIASWVVLVCWFLLIRVWDTHYLLHQWDHRINIQRSFLLIHDCLVQ